MRKIKIVFFGILILVLAAGLIYAIFNKIPTKLPLTTDSESSPVNEGGGIDDRVSSLTIEEMRKKEYPGSDITIEQELQDGQNYKRYIVSYKSEGLKIFALLTVPQGEKPKSGWPAIIFNHGYIPPKEYSTTQRYEAYIDALAKEGYVIFKPDYRGNGNSEGKPSGNYYSPDYVTDVLNAFYSVRKYKDVNPEKVGMWGHSMGGNITMKNLVISKDIKAAVIWAGVVGSYQDILNNWNRSFARQNPDRQSFLGKYGAPDMNPQFWESIDPFTYIKDISAPIQLHHGLSDNHVPSDFSKNFYNELKRSGKSVEFYTYEGADHNLSGPEFQIAMKRSVEFFNSKLIR